MKKLHSRLQLEFQRPPEQMEQAAIPSETLVVDARVGVRPNQMVEQKLIWLLRGLPVPASWLVAGRPRWVVPSKEAVHQAGQPPQA